MVDRKDKRFFDFMCSCGEENMERCEKVYEDVKAELEADDKEFVNHIVYGLQYMKNGLAEIVGIPSDMWSAISVEYHYDYDEDRCECGKGAEHNGCECSESKVQKFWIECDLIHHGLARAYQLVKEFDENMKPSES